MKKIVLLFFLLKIVTCKDRVIIFYDSLDAKSKKFIGEQLELSLVEKDIELQFVPFGLTKMIQIDSDHYIFDCKNGQIECELNKLHACVATDSQTTKKGKLAAINCLLSSSSTNITALITDCCSKSKWYYDEISPCYYDNADVTLAYFGRLTNMQNITRIPTVLINHERLDDFQDQILNDFSSFLNDYEKCKSSIHTVDKDCLKKYSHSAGVILNYNIIALSLSLTYLVFNFINH